MRKFWTYCFKNKFISFPPLFFSNNFFAPNTDIFSDLFKEMQKRNIISFASDLISKGEIICIYDGGSETGPRALGNRSIICSAKLSKTVEMLNSKIKGRENFRPLAPIILNKNLKKFFYVNDKFEHNLEWMGLTVNAKKSHFKNTLVVYILTEQQEFKL